jgi:hypothetical protein
MIAQSPNNESIDPATEDDGTVAGLMRMAASTRALPHLDSRLASFRTLRHIDRHF